MINKKDKDIILVVDDKPNNLKVITSVLGGEYTVSIANSGMNTLRMIDSVKPDLILLDIMMPGMDGIEVCQRLKQNPNTSGIPIIFLTAKTDIEDIVKGFESGAVDYITKPFNPTEVRMRVKNHLSLYHARKEIEQINQEKDKFFSIIAHDLKSPFNSILGFSDLLKEEANQLEVDEVKQYATLLFDSASHTLQLLENLLSWARIQQGRMEFYPQNLLFDEVVNEVFDIITENAHEKNITLVNHIRKNIAVNVDDNMLKTVLRNLVSNAIKYSNPGGQVEIDCKVDENWIQVVVSDTGIGIGHENIEKLFNIGSSFSTPGTGKEKGTGLGLLLCKEFIEKHGGKIWAESEPGKGSRFYFTLSLMK